MVQMIDFSKLIKFDQVAHDMGQKLVDQLQYQQVNKTQQPWVNTIEYNQRVISNHGDIIQS
jgi:hypothetical protein